MEKVRTFIKRPVNFNLVSLIAVALFYLIIAVLGAVKYCSIVGEISNMKSDIDNTLGGEVGDVEGYGVIAESIGYIFALMGRDLFVYCMVIIPIVFAVIITLFAVISRLVYKKGITTYRILMGICYFLLALLLIPYSGISLTFGIVGELFAILNLCVLITGIRNTYSQRIFL